LPLLCVPPFVSFLFPSSSYGIAPSFSSVSEVFLFFSQLTHDRAIHLFSLVPSQVPKPRRKNGCRYLAFLNPVFFFYGLPVSCPPLKSCFLSLSRQVLKTFFGIRPCVLLVPPPSGLRKGCGWPIGRILPPPPWNYFHLFFFFPQRGAGPCTPPPKQSLQIFFFTKNFISPPPSFLDFPFPPSVVLLLFLFHFICAEIFPISFPGKYLLVWTELCAVSSEHLLWLFYSIQGYVLSQLRRPFATLSYLQIFPRDPPLSSLLGTPLFFLDSLFKMVQKFSHFLFQSNSSVSRIRDLTEILPRVMVFSYVSNHIPFVFLVFCR